MEGNDPENSSSSYDWAQISFALQPRRLFFIDKPNCWLEFHSANQENMHKYYEYSPEQLRDHFLNNVLVRINNYELTDEECHILNLLELHPNFRRTEDGFIKINEGEIIDFSRDAANVDLLMDDAGEDLNCKIVLTSNDVDSEGEHRSKFQLSEENAALLSVALSSDDDLPTCERLTDGEMQKRMREAKRLFEQSGQQLENVNITIDDLLDKVNTTYNLKKMLVKLIKKGFK